jgi:multiple sugar transport system permease protein
LATAREIEITTTPPQTAAKGRKRSARASRQFDGREGWVALLMVGIPTILHVALVWIPTITSIGLSFTSWKGIRVSAIL